MLGLWQTTDLASQVAEPRQGVGVAVVAAQAGVGTGHRGGDDEKCTDVVQHTGHRQEHAAGQIGEQRDRGQAVAEPIMPVPVRAPRPPSAAAVRLSSARPAADNTMLNAWRSTSVPRSRSPRSRTLVASAARYASSAPAKSPASYIRDASTASDASGTRPRPRQRCCRGQANPSKPGPTAHPPSTSRPDATLSMPCSLGYPYRIGTPGNPHTGHTARSLAPSGDTFTAYDRGAAPSLGLSAARGPIPGRFAHRRGDRFTTPKILATRRPVAQGPCGTGRRYACGVR